MRCSEAAGGAPQALKVQVPDVGLGAAGKRCGDNARRVGMNKKNYSPPIDAIKALYFSKFRGKGHKQEEPPASDDEE